MPDQTNYVQALAAQLQQGLEGLTDGGAAQTVWGVNDRCVLGSRAQVIDDIRRLLVESRQVFVLDNDVVYEQRSQAGGKRLVALMHEDRLTSAAPSHVSNILHCGMMGKDAAVTVQIPAKLLSEVLNNSATRDQLPRIDLYCRRPVLGLDFQLCGPGYDAGRRILMHGEEITPVLWTTPHTEDQLERLPPGLRSLFKDFCFASAADLANALAMLLTGLLINHFLQCGKPCFVLNGNRRNIGKTLLAVVIAMVLDGEEPPIIQYTEDQDELGKRLGVHIKPGARLSVLLFDNLKGSIGGGLLESLALRPRVSVRRLGHNEDISRTNDFLWAFTANNAKATADMTTRSVFVSLHNEGDLQQRFADADVEEERLKRFVRENRSQLLGELLGLVVRWRQQAIPPLGQQKHRCRRWAQVIGGILSVAGFPEFLAHQDEVVAEIDEDLQELAALAEHVVSRQRTELFVTGAGATNVADVGRPAGDWVGVFRDARLCERAVHEAAGERMRASIVGTFFSAHLGRHVTVQVQGQTGRAVLRVQPGRSRTRRYWLEVEWDGEATAPPAATPPPTEPVPSPDVTVPAAEAPPVASCGDSASPLGYGNNLDWGADG